MSKPVLPSFSAIIDATSTTSSPLPRSASMGFRMDIQGNIRLPPLSGNDPQTPIVKNNLLSITPTTSMLRIGTASTSSVDVDHVTTSSSTLVPTPGMSSKSLLGANARASRSSPTASGSNSTGRSLSVNLSIPDNGTLQHTPSKRPKVTKRSNSAGNNLVLTDPESLDDSDSKNSSAKKRTNKAKSFAFITHSQETFPSNEPSIDNAQLARRKRRRTSKNESDILKKEFEVNPAPSKERRSELSIICNMSEKAVQVWFQNRRQNFRKKFKVDSKQINSPLDDSNNIGLNDTAKIPDLRDQISSPTESISNADGMQTDDSLQQNHPLIEITTSNIATVSTTKRNSSNDNGSLVIMNDELKFQKKLKLDIPRYTISSPPEKITSPSEKGKVLTFRLKQDNELSRVYTSPNNRVNKLINGTNIKDFVTTPVKEVTDENVKMSENMNTAGKLNFSSNRGILKELNINTT